MTEARKSSVESAQTRYHSAAETPSAICPECKGDNGHNIGCIRARRPKPYNFLKYPETGYPHTEPENQIQPHPDLGKGPTFPNGALVEPWKQFQDIAKSLDPVVVTIENGKAAISTE